MNKFKNNIATKVLTLLLAFLLLVPASVKFAHIFSHHKHDICNGKKTTHLHQTIADCDLYKFKLSHSYTFNVTIFDLFSPSIVPQLTICPPKHLISFKSLQTSLRGPPVII